MKLIKRVFKNIIIASFLFILLIVNLFGQEKNFRVAGKWIRTGEIYRKIKRNYSVQRKSLFYESNFGINIIREGIWSLKGNSLTLKAENGKHEKIKIISQKNNILVISDFKSGKEKLHYKSLQIKGSIDKVWKLEYRTIHNKKVFDKRKLIFVLKKNGYFCYGWSFSWIKDKIQFIIKESETVSLKMSFKSKNELHIIYPHGLSLILQRELIKRKPQWSLFLGKYIMMKPLMVNKIIYAGAYKTLYALSAQSGKIIWKRKLDDQIIHSILLYKNRLYFNTRSNYFYCVDALNGKSIWRFNARFDDDVIMRKPVLRKGIVYFGSLSHHLYALNAKTGKLLWKFKGGKIVSNPVYKNNILYCTSTDRHLYALNVRDGKVIWKLKLKNKVYLKPFLYKNILCVSDSYEPGKYTRIVGININTRKIVWTFFRDKLNPFISLFQNRLFVITQDTLYALDAVTGKAIWMQKNRYSRSWNRIIFSPVVHDKKLYFIDTGNNRFYIHDVITGRLISEIPFYGKTYSTPIIKGNRIFYGESGYYKLLILQNKNY